MRKKFTRHLGLGLLVFASVPASAQEPVQNEGGAVLDIRADPTVAAKVNEVLGLHAQSIATEVPADQDPTQYLAELCGSKGAVAFSQVDVLADGVRRVWHQPCVRIERDTVVTVELGLTLEDIAVRSGLTRNKASLLRAEPGPNQQEKRITPTNLQPGDKVLVAEAARWTQVRLQDPAMDRDALVDILAAALGCRDEAAYCLLSRGVSVLERQHAANAVQPAAIVLPPAGEAVEAILPLAATPVDPAQWPYDQALVRKLLEDERGRMIPVIVGVADTGLADEAGAPLTPMLQQNRREIIEASNGVDDDGNEYVDDVYGAGPTRSEIVGPGLSGTGNLNLCEQRSVFDGLSTDQMMLASHGAMVGSIASGWRLRQDPADIAPGLPGIVFFRLAKQQCLPEMNMRFLDGDLVAALRYFQPRDVDVINFSFKMEGGRDTSWLYSSASAMLNNSTDMLVVAAGNDDGVDLDEGYLCPACLGSETFVNRQSGGLGQLYKRVLVVGAAGRDLRRSPGSNTGVQTVRFLAPGRPEGIDINGMEVIAADDRLSATSFAAPRASLAVSLLKAFGLKTWQDVSQRLNAASWPQTLDNGTIDWNTPVVDLNKVAATNRDVIEASVDGEDGPLRRNIVGDIQDKIHDLEICSGRALSRTEFHSIRLGPVRIDGTRDMRADPLRRGKPSHYPKPTAVSNCRSVGVVKIKDVDGVLHSIPLERVNQLLLRWTKS